MIRRFAEAVMIKNSPRLKTRATLLVVMLALAAAPMRAQAPAEKFEFYPGAKYDPAIPTLKQVTGHDWGEKITSHPQIERYIEALAKASPRVRVVKYAETYEGRALYYLILASEANMARLEAIKSGMQRLADPRGLAEAEAEKLIATLPPVTWLARRRAGTCSSAVTAGACPPTL